MQVVAVGGGEKTWLNSLLLHFNVAVHLKREGKKGKDSGCGPVIHLFR